MEIRVPAHLAEQTYQFAVKRLSELLAKNNPKDDFVIKGLQEFIETYQTWQAKNEK